MVMQIVENDNGNNLVTFAKIHHSLFEYLNDKVWLPGPLKSMVIQHWEGDISLEFTLF